MCWGRMPQASGIFFRSQCGRDALGAERLVGLAGGPPADILVGWRMSLQVTSSF